MPTKVCLSCEKEIGESEKDCPACGVNLEELEDAVATVEKAQAILDKRRKPITPPVPEPTPEPAKKTSRLVSLGKVLRRK